jgi:hypothetical protein
MRDARTQAARHSTHFNPQQWLLYHMGLYESEIEFMGVARPVAILWRPSPWYHGISHRLASTSHMSPQVGKIPPVFSSMSCVWDYFNELRRLLSITFYRGGYFKHSPRGIKNSYWFTYGTEERESAHATAQASQRQLSPAHSMAIARYASHSGSTVPSFSAFCKALLHRWRTFSLNLFAGSSLVVFIRFRSRST